MTRNTNSGIRMAAACLVASGSALASVDRTLWTDSPGDTRIRRTDSGADGVLLPGATLPDILSVSLIPWAPLNPVANPYVGLPAEVADAQIVRIDVVFAGLVNPPGPLGLNGADYEPDRFGPSPVYGFVEIDVDRDRNTGGEFPAQARSRALGIAGRFGGRFADPYLVDRVPTCAADMDTIWSTPPFFERTGADFALAMCGCFDAEIVSQTGNHDGRLDPGEEMVVRGRFFQRAGGYRLASQIFGGSDIGLYDPVVNLRFAHEASTNLTVVSLVFPLTQAGAAMLTGEPEQPIDTSIAEGSHFSIAEALADVIAGAGGSNSGLTYQLIHRWLKKNPSNYLNPLLWRTSAIVGTAYAQPEDSLYVWTDVGFDILQGDVDGDSAVTPSDRTAVEWFIAFNDGSGIDMDGMYNGRVVLDDVGPNFSLFDVTGDGIVGAEDVAWFQFPVACPADWDGNGSIQVPDIFAFLSSWFGGNADFDNNGRTEVPDIFAFLSAWFSGPCA